MGEVFSSPDFTEKTEMKEGRGEGVIQLQCLPQELQERNFLMLPVKTDICNFVYPQNQVTKI